MEEENITCRELGKVTVLWTTYVLQFHQKAYLDNFDIVFVPMKNECMHLSWLIIAAVEFYLKYEAYFLTREILIMLWKVH